MVVLWIEWFLRGRVFLKCYMIIECCDFLYGNFFFYKRLVVFLVVLVGFISIWKFNIWLVVSIFGYICCWVYGIDFCFEYFKFIFERFEIGYFIIIDIVIIVFSEKCF